MHLRLQNFKFIGLVIKTHAKSLDREYIKKAWDFSSCRIHSTTNYLKCIKYIPCGLALRISLSAGCFWKQDDLTQYLISDQILREYHMYARKEHFLTFLRTFFKTMLKGTALLYPIQFNIDLKVSFTH